MSYHGHSQPFPCPFSSLFEVARVTHSSSGSLFGAVKSSHVCVTGHGIPCAQSAALFVLMTRKPNRQYLSHSTPRQARAPGPLPASSQDLTSVSMPRPKTSMLDRQTARIPLGRDSRPRRPIRLDVKSFCGTAEPEVDDERNVMGPLFRSRSSGPAHTPSQPARAIAHSPSRNPPHRAPLGPLLGCHTRTRPFRRSCSRYGVHLSIHLGTYLHGFCRGIRVSTDRYPAVPWRVQSGASLLLPVLSVSARQKPPPRPYCILQPSPVLEPTAPSPRRQSLQTLSTLANCCLARRSRPSNSAIRCSQDARVVARASTLCSFLPTIVCSAGIPSSFGQLHPFICCGSAGAQNPASRFSDPRLASPVDSLLLRDKSSIEPVSRHLRASWTGALVGPLTVRPRLRQSDERRASGDWRVSLRSLASALPRLCAQSQRPLVLRPAC